MPITHDNDATTWRDLPDLPIPASATAGHWSDLTDIEGGIVRSLEWSRHDAAGVGVAVDGWQQADGRIDRCVSLYDTESTELTAARCAPACRRDA